MATQIQNQAYERLCSRCYGDNSVPIYGSAVFVDTTNPDDIVRHILMAISEAKFREPQTSAETVAQQFCSLILVDTALYEAYLGISFMHFNSVNLTTITAFIQQWGR